MTNELIQKAKECKSAEELLALAKENGIELTAEEAAARLAVLNNEGELADDELENAAGGGCDTSVGDKKYTIVTSAKQCFTDGYEKGYSEYRGYYVPTRKDNVSLRCTWFDMSGGENTCGRCKHLGFNGGTGYCELSEK